MINRRRYMGDMGTPVTIFGVPPITTNKRKLLSLKAFGGTEQRNLPDGYIEQQFIHMMDGSYLLTDIVPTYDGHYEMDFQTTTVSTVAAAYLGGRADQSPAGLIFSHGSGNVLVTDAFGQRYSIAYRAENNTRYKYVFNNKVFTLYKNGEVVETYTFTSSADSGDALAIKAINMGGSINFANEGIYLYGFKAWNAQGELIADYVPAVQKGTVPVVGFYDTVSGTFKTATAGTFAAGGEAVPTPDAPMDIISNNGVIKVSKNLCNNVFEQGSINVDGSDSGGSETTSRIRLKNFITLPAGTYSISCDDTYEMYLYRTGGTAGWVQTDTFTFSSTGQVRFAVRNKANPTADVLPTAAVNVMLNAGSSALPYTPYSATGVYTDGTVETINVHTKNLYNPATAVDAYLTDTGGLTPSIQGKASAFIRVKPSTTYTLKFLRTAQDIYTRVCSYDENEDFLTLLIKDTDLTEGYKTETFTTDANAKYIRVSFKADSTEVQLEQGSTATEYVPFFDGGTATAEMLLKAGNYEDVQSIIDGVVTRNVGVKVLKGTEGWVHSVLSNGLIRVYSTGVLPLLPTEDIGLVSHFSLSAFGNRAVGRTPNTAQLGNISTRLSYLGFKIYQSDFADATAFSQFLADQYTAGTPVIIVYPLATPTTESVAGQTLKLTRGTNIIDITQASLDKLELEVVVK